MLAITNIEVTKNGHCLLNANQLNVQSSELVAVLGQNGAGKSTLLKAVSGEWEFQTGEIEFYGQSINAWPRTGLAKSLAVLPQASQVEFPFLVHEIVAIGALPLTLTRAEIRANVDQYLKLTDTWHLRDRMYVQLSGGERQRVHLARVLLQLSQSNKAPLLLLDEPTSAQDLGHQHEIMSLVTSLAKEKGFGLLAVLHDLNLAVRYADRVAIVHDHHLVANDVPASALSPENVRDYWQYLPEKVTSNRNGFALL